MCHVTPDILNIFGVAPKRHTFQAVLATPQANSNDNTYDNATTTTTTTTNNNNNNNTNFVNADSNANSNDNTNHNNDTSNDNVSRLPLKRGRRQIRTLVFRISVRFWFLFGFLGL
jgi:hypothetical protein